MIDKIVLLVRLQTKPGKKAQFLIHLKSVLETMSAEPNFVNAIIHQRLDSPNDVVVYETWLGTRETWLRDEYPRPYRRPYEAILDELIEDRSVDWLVPFERWSVGAQRSSSMLDEGVEQQISALPATGRSSGIGE